MAIARAEVGTRERAGDADNPRVVEYLRSVVLPPHKLRDMTPWCSAFVNFCVEQSGHLGTRKANARSWLAWGVPLVEPRPGCITVLWRLRREGLHGHVGFWTHADERYVYLLSGNQHNAVNVLAYRRNRVLGYRWPA